MLDVRELYLATKNVNDDLEVAFSHWRKEGYRDYDQLIIYMMEKDIAQDEARAILYSAFMAGYDAERKA